MSYFGGTSGMVGDPGFFGSLFGGVKALGKVGLGFATGGVTGGIGAGISQFRGRGSTAPANRPLQPFQPPIGIKAGGFLPGGAKPFIGVVRADGSVGPRRRRINYGNTKALRRAVRRTDGFVRVARTALKNTGFKIVSKSSGKMTEAAWAKKAHHAK